MNLPLILIALGGVLLAAAVGTLVAMSRGRTAREVAEGLGVLRSLRWREFAQVVVNSLEAKGYKSDPEHGLYSEDGGDILLTNGKLRHVLHVKHGGAYHVGAAPVRALAKALPLNGAQAGLLVTSGNFTAEAQTAVAGEPITLVEGERLWRDIRAHLPAALLADARARVAEGETTQKTRVSLLAVAGALAFCAGSWFWYQDRSIAAPDAVATVVPPRSAPSPATAAPAAPAPTEAPARPPPRPAPRDYTEAELATERESLVAEVLVLPGISSAAWPSKSTLMLTLRSNAEPARSETLDQVCERIAQRDALLFTRLQVQALDAVDQAVRWHRCA